MAPIDKIVAERDAIADTISRIEGKVSDHPINPIPEVTVLKLLQGLPDVETDLKNIHTKIRSLCPDPVEMDIHKRAYFDLADVIDSIHNSLHGIKANFKASKPQVPLQQNSSVSLPKLQLPSFDGNLLEWSGFRDIFDSSVIQNVSLSNCQKLTYLKTLVRGEAAKQIQGMILSDSNFDLAWKQLNDRYQNDRELLFAVLRKFHTQPTVHPSSSAIRSLIDNSQECLRSLEVLNLKADKSSEAMMLYVITTKFDQQTRELWEQSLKGTAIPPLSEIFEFLEQRGRAVAAGGGVKFRPPQDHAKRMVVHHGQSDPNGQSVKCKICLESPHPLFKCKKFNTISISERYDALRKHNMCFNCLNDGHSALKCQKEGRCKTCNGRHHTMLHNVPHSTQPSTPSSQATVTLHTREDILAKQTLLATANILVTGIDGQQHKCRALLDGGSTSSFVTERCLKRIGLQRRKTSVEVFGLAAAAVGTCRGTTSIKFTPHFYSKESFTVQALVLPKVTGELPLFKCDAKGWTHLEGLNLADPEFNIPAHVDILLGSDIFWHLLDGGQKVGASGTPLGIGSSLGWLVAGHVDQYHKQAYVHIADVALDRQVQAFWELEEVPTHKVLTAEESQCESFFESNHSRDSSGRFTVSLPFKNPKPALGDSKRTALRRLQQLERRLEKSPIYQKQYREFMNEYIALGHMTIVPDPEVINPVSPTYFIPHHFVLKEESTTTKFRVVFDASAATSSGVSLNDAMMVGPSLQDMLVDIIMRFRLHKIAVTADIAKMYRQIIVTKSDMDLQRIFWRNTPSEAIKEYRLKTVTYGTASAPYLAVKVLQQLANYESSSYPLASAAALKDFYVDDLMSGASTAKEAIELHTQLRSLMEKGGFELRKWTSNSKEVLDSLPTDLLEKSTHLEIDINPSVKALGIRWNTRDDRFEFQCKYEDLPVPSSSCTKRLILSEISKLFDPLGWLSPVVIRAKIFMQSLWKIKQNWDDVLPIDLQQYWYEFKMAFKQINTIYIPRCIINHKPVRVDLVGFSDASEKAYAGVVYLCVYYQDGCEVSLVTSKTRVAPAKQVSLPRLELCGSLLLAELMESVRLGLNIKVTNMRAFSDSTVVLAWLQSHPSKWKNFVANRVTKIQNILPGDVWNHVPGVDNPADCASRGITPAELRDHSLWWNGPTWLMNPDAASPSCVPPNLQKPELELLEEEQRQVQFVGTAQVSQNSSLLYKYSSLTKLIRVTAWIQRFSHNCKFKSKKQSGPLTPLELQEGENKWIRNTQNQIWEEEIHCLMNKKPLPAKSRLLCLHPFVDQSGILRVGGRLKNAVICQDQKTPILIPRHSKFTDLLIISKHKAHLHAGPNLLIAVIQQRYWIIRVRDAVRFLIKKCIICTKNSAQLQHQFMGDLPSSRVTQCQAFERCGVDYAGPFLIKPDLTRSKTTLKAYLALFVCFSTRAFHLEVVSTLSTDSFLSALRRFVSRRGLPSHIHSDCGTNFVGANRELKVMLALFYSNTHNDKVANSLAKDGIHWHFNPAGAPHFGGLWEAGVKSVKFHLNRIVGNTRLTFEELTTIMTQIESCLNSRPLTAFSTDPSDLNTLTSGHFLIGKPLLAIPEPDLSALPQNHLSRFQLIQSFQQQFWKRWSNEFLTRLQQRPKWLHQRTNLRLDDLVLIKEDNLPPLKWKTGRVIALYPGKDNIIRVVGLRTPDGEIKRPIHKLCLLPIDNALNSKSELV